MCDVVDMCDRQEELKVLIKSEACLLAHEQLVACMAEHNRSWSKCQTFVKALKLCQDRQTGSAESSSPATTSTSIGPAGGATVK